MIAGNTVLSEKDVSAVVVFHLHSLSQDAITMRPWGKRKFLHTVTTRAVKIGRSRWETCWNFEARKESRRPTHNWLLHEEDEAQRCSLSTARRPQGRADAVLVTTDSAACQQRLENGQADSNGEGGVHFAGWCGRGRQEPEMRTHSWYQKYRAEIKVSFLKHLYSTWVSVQTTSFVSGDNNTWSNLSPLHGACALLTKSSSSLWDRGRGRGKSMESPAQHFPVCNQTLESLRIPGRNVTWRATLLTPNGEPGTCDPLASQISRADLTLMWQFHVNCNHF